MTQLILTRAEPFLVSIDTKPLERAASRVKDSPNGLVGDRIIGTPLDEPRDGRGLGRALGRVSGVLRLTRPIA